MISDCFVAVTPFLTPPFFTVLQLMVTAHWPGRYPIQAVNIITRFQQTHMHTHWPSNAYKHARRNQFHTLHQMKHSVTEGI